VAPRVTSELFRDRILMRHVTLGTSFQPSTSVWPDSTT
jgi:hypothetical protein